MPDSARPDLLLQSYDRGEHEQEMGKVGIGGDQAAAIAGGVEEASKDTHNYYEAMLKILEGHDNRLNGIDKRLDGIEGQLGRLRAMGGIFLEDADVHEFRIGSLSIGPEGGNIALCTGCGWQRVGHGGTADLKPLHREHVEQVRAFLSGNPN